MSLGQHSFGLVGLAFLAGACFACIGVSYRVGQARGVRPTQIALVMSLVGAAVFGLRCRGLAFEQVPLRLWLVGLGAGAGQYCTMVLIRRALARGGLTAMWCAVGLQFLPVILYARFVLDELISPLRLLGVTAGIACVLVAALRQKAGSGPRPRRQTRAGGYAAHAAVLLGILLCNSVVSIGIKDLSARPGGSAASYLSRFGELYYALMYVGLGGLICLEVVARKGIGVPLRRLLPVGLLAACGSTIGLWAMGLSAALPAALVFTISGVVSILGAALVSVLALGERPTRLWYAMVALAVLAIVLVQAA